MSVIVEVLDGYSEIQSGDIVIPLIPTSVSQDGLVFYNDPDSISLDQNGAVKNIYPWIGDESKKLTQVSLSQAPTVVTDGLGNKFWQNDGTTKYLVPAPAPAGSVISTADFTAGYSSFWIVKENDNTVTNRMFQIFSSYFSIYTVSSVRTFEGKRISPVSNTIQATAPTTGTVCMVGFTLNATTGQMILYINGVQVATNTNSGWLNYTSALSSVTYFGSNGVSSTNSSKMNYGAWALYNKALEAENVTSLWNYWKTKYGL